jgi:hypothetical protein
VPAPDAEGDDYLPTVEIPTRKGRFLLVPEVPMHTGLATPTRQDQTFCPAISRPTGLAERLETMASVGRWTEPCANGLRRGSPAGVSHHDEQVP